MAVPFGDGAQTVIQAIFFRRPTVSLFHGRNADITTARPCGDHSYTEPSQTVRRIMSKTALVLGAGGFIGGHIVHRLKHEGFWVRGVDLKLPEFREVEADDFLVG